MEVRSFTSYGVLVATYFCKTGEGLPMHGHPPGVTHGHCVLAGSCMLEIAGEPNQVRTPNDGYIELPPDKRHSIIALEDGTIFTNPQTVASIGATAGPPLPYKNRVLMADGTIVEIE